MLSSGKTRTRPAGESTFPLPTTPPRNVSLRVTTPSMKKVTGGSSQAQATTNESISNQTTTAAMHETETTAHAAMTTVSTMNETEADKSSSITTPTMDTESEQMTLVMAIVGSVVGLLLLLVVVVCVITICTAAASRQKIKTSPGLNKCVKMHSTPKTAALLPLVIYKTSCSNRQITCLKYHTHTHTCTHFKS